MSVAAPVAAAAALPSGLGLQPDAAAADLAKSAPALVPPKVNPKVTSRSAHAVLSFEDGPAALAHLVRTGSFERAGIAKYASVVDGWKPEELRLVSRKFGLVEITGQHCSTKMKDAIVALIRETAEANPHLIPHIVEDEPSDPDAAAEADSPEPGDFAAFADLEERKESHRTPPRPRSSPKRRVSKKTVGSLSEKALAELDRLPPMPVPKKKKSRDGEREKPATAPLSPPHSRSGKRATTPIRRRGSNKHRLPESDQPSDSSSSSDSESDQSPSTSGSSDDSDSSSSSNSDSDNTSSDSTSSSEEGRSRRKSSHRHSHSPSRGRSLKSLRHLAPAAPKWLAYLFLTRRVARAAKKKFVSKMKGHGILLPMGAGFVENALRNYGGRGKLYHIFDQDMKLKEKRNRIEILALAAIADEMLAGDPDYAFELVIRRLAGVHSADLTGNWALCAEYGLDTSSSSFVPTKNQTTAVKNVARMQSLSKPSASSYAANRDSSSKSASFSSKWSNNNKESAYSDRQAPVASSNSYTSKKASGGSSAGARK
jgi:hypothetical protein